MQRGKKREEWEREKGNKGLECNVDLLDFVSLFLFVFISFDAVVVAGSAYGRGGRWG